MTKLLEITPRGITLWTMPDFVAEAVTRAIQLRLARSVSAALLYFPREVSSDVRASSLPPPEPHVCGYSGDVFVDEPISASAHIEATWSPL